MQPITIFFDREQALSARGPTSGTYCDFVNLLDFDDAIPRNII